MSPAARSLRPRPRRIGPAPRPRKKPQPPRPRQGIQAPPPQGRPQGPAALALPAATQPSRGSRVALSLAKRTAARPAVFAARPAVLRLSAVMAAAPRLAADRPGAAKRRRAPPRPSAPSLAVVAGPPALRVPSHPARRLELRHQPFRPLPPLVPRRSTSLAATHPGIGHPQRLPAPAAEARASQPENGSGHAPARPARRIPPGAGRRRDPPRPLLPPDPRATALRASPRPRSRRPPRTPPPDRHLPCGS